MNTTKLSRKAQDIIGSRKQKCFVTEISEPREISTSSYWDSGSRNTYAVLNLKTRNITIPFGGQYPTFEAKHTLQLGEVLIRTGTFIGKPATPSITYLASDKNEVAAMFELDLNNLQTI